LKFLFLSRIRHISQRRSNIAYKSDSKKEDGPDLFSLEIIFHHLQAAINLSKKKTKQRKKKREAKQKYSMVFTSIPLYFNTPTLQKKISLFAQPFSCFISFSHMPFLLLADLDF
jgi:hypothetical protein